MGNGAGSQKTKKIYVASKEPVEDDFVVAEPESSDPVAENQSIARAQTPEEKTTCDDAGMHGAVTSAHVAVAVPTEADSKLVMEEPTSAERCTASPPSAELSSEATQ